jgi:hypothetical protein
VEPRDLRWVLWTAAFCMLPVPLFGVSPALVPPLHQLELGALALAFTVLEQAQGMGALLSALFLGQALLWGLVLFPPASLLARPLGRLSPRARTRATVALIVFAFALADVYPIYRTPYSNRSAESPLLRMYW